MSPLTPEPPQLSFLRDLPLTREAVAFASDHHGGQRREADGAPFLLHPLEVASMLERDGSADRVIAAAVLHDVLEDTNANQSELRARFGPDVSTLVSLVSDDPSISDEEERKNDVRERVRQAGGEALVVYAADKISKVRELRMLIARGLPAEPAAIKRRRYRASLSMLEQEMSESRLVAILRFELEALEQLPPEAPA
ncbi:MAG: bifunctional (p)ppGpp synthetase/guanosine-3',5'-bis(diphosphate) 3'-pyrophosphohydrolase [Solirubrobacterales bacterium]|nr:bifunctional (p)ppGpp synthetase/guanosine-3',5'-bis(diphosphate) 3'-pyrophosphohydrolase [Solirubrobacterales bacterium]